jgi:cobalamin biosynthesis protein CobD/CbiB
MQVTDIAAVEEHLNKHGVRTVQQIVRHAGVQCEQVYILLPMRLHLALVHVVLLSDASPIAIFALVLTNCLQVASLSAVQAGTLSSKLVVYVCCSLP